MRVRPPEPEPGSDVGMRIVDNRGLPCPQPVVNTRRALQETGAPLVCLVDSEAARENVTRFATSQGYHVEAEGEGDTWRLTITRPGDARAEGLPGAGVVVPAAAPEPSPAAAARAGARVLLVGGDRLGRGPDELGAVLMRSFLYTLAELADPPDTLIFVNTGVRLTTRGSPVLEELGRLRYRGVEILSCGTCLDYFGLRDQLAVGRVTNMYEIAEKLTSGGPVLSL